MENRSLVQILADVESKVKREAQKRELQEHFKKCLGIYSLLRKLNEGEI